MDGFRSLGGGRGGFFLPIGGGGLGFAAKSGLVWLCCAAGRRLFLSAATPPGKAGALGALFRGGGGAEGGKGGAPGGLPGGEGAKPFGNEGAGLRLVGGGGVLRGGGLRALVSGSESYAPVLTPPLFRSLGMPPANKPPSCGALSMAAAAGRSPPLEPWSLLLRARFCPAGAGGRRPGIGGAPPIGGPAFAFGFVSTIGADRSFICVTFFSRAPLLMSLSRAPCESHR